MPDNHPTMKRLLLLLVPLALAAGCRTAGPYERNFRFTAATLAAPAVPAAPAANAETNAAVAAVPAVQIAEASWEIPDDPVIPAESIVTAELASPADAAAWFAAGWTEIGRSEFVSTHIPARSGAVAFAARLGAPGVLFLTEDLGAHWVWRTEWEPRRVYRPLPPPPPHARHHHGPPPPLYVSEIEHVPVDRLRLERYYRNLAIFLGGAVAPAEAE